MISTEIQNIIRSQPERVLELRLLRGSSPWSLAGTDGMKRAENLALRDGLVARINAAIGPLGWSATLEPVTSAAGRVNKLELVLHGPGHVKEVWSW
jgi:hypothetical protein